MILAVTPEGILFTVLALVAVAAGIAALVRQANQNNPFSPHYRPPAELEIDTLWLSGFAARCSGGYYFATLEYQVTVKLGNPAWEATVLWPDGRRVDASVRTRSDLRAFLASQGVDLPREAG